MSTKLCKTSHHDSYMHLHLLQIEQAPGRLEFCQRTTIKYIFWLVYPTQSVMLPELSVSPQIITFLVILPVVQVEYEVSPCEGGIMCKASLTKKKTPCSLPNNKIIMIKLPSRK